MFKIIQRALILTSVLLGIVALAYAMALGTWLNRGYHALERQLEHGLIQLGFVVNKVYVDGRVRQSRASLLKALTIPEGAPIFGIDLAQAHQRVEALPWVKSARLTRRLPDTIYVQLRERIPHMIWESHGEPRLLDKYGKRIAITNLADFSHLPRFSGETSAAAAFALLEALQPYPALQGQIVAGIHLAQRRWVLELITGGYMHLPTDPRQIDAALARFVNLQKSAEILSVKDQDIDLRFGDRILLRPTQNHMQPIAVKARP